MNLAFREKRHFNFALMKRCAYAAFNAGVGEKARADARIILEGIKNSTTQTRTKGSNYVVWQKQVNQGTSQETLVLPSFTGPNNPTFTAPGGLSVQIAEGDFRSQINTLSAQPGMGCHKSFMVSCPLALLGSAFYAVLVHRLAIYAPRFLPTLSRPHAVALHFARCDQLAAGHLHPQVCAQAGRTRRKSSRDRVVSRGFARQPERVTALPQVARTGERVSSDCHLEPDRPPMGAITAELTDRL